MWSRARQDDAPKSVGLILIIIRGESGGEDGGGGESEGESEGEGEGEGEEKGEGGGAAAPRGALQAPEAGGDASRGDAERGGTGGSP